MARHTGDEATRQLIAEIREIAAQYAQEVSRDRKTWPQSIKSRVLQLGALGHRWTEVSKLTQIPYYTILNWTYRNRRIPFEERVRHGQFRSVTVTDPVPAASSIPTATDPVAPKNDRAISIAVGDRIRIEGLNVRELLLVLKRVKP